MNQDVKDQSPANKVMSLGELALLGQGEVAYIKVLKPVDVKKLFPQLTGLPEGIDLFAVYAADGRPLALTDSMNMAIANVKENDLLPVSVH